ncbi:MAG TPA: hypothetical protein VNR87_15460, partial [Flavisolibacter sp.]|nr:hypothetical protein [Flavisolibacter sp.]
TPASPYAYITHSLVVSTMKMTASNRPVLEHLQTQALATPGPSGYPGGNVCLWKDQGSSGRNFARIIIKTSMALRPKQNSLQ